MELMALGAITALATTAAPKPVSGTDLRSWDELDVLTRLTADFDVTWIGRVRLSDKLPNPARKVFGTDWNFSLSTLWVITPSWYYETYRTASGATGERRSPIFAVTPTVSFGNWTVTDRNRIGLRMDSRVGDSWFYRNRVRLDYHAHAMPSFFAWDEV